LQLELDAIGTYQAHIDQTDNEDIKEVLSHLRDQEKNHVMEIIELFQKYDDYSTIAEHKKEEKH